MYVGHVLRSSGKDGTRPSIPDRRDLWEAPYMADEDQSPLQRAVQHGIDRSGRARDALDSVLRDRLKTTGKPLYDVVRGKSKRPEARTLRAIEHVLELKPESLVQLIHGGVDAPQEAEQQNDGTAATAQDREGLADRLGLHLVPEFDTGWAMGEGTFLDVVERTGFRAFDREWLRSVTSGNLGKLFVAHGDGDSMEPTLHDGDVVLIDMAQTVIEKQDRIWALVVGGLGTIKRVSKLPSGDYELAGDNHRVRPKTYGPGEFQVAGRVVWIGRRI